MALISQELGHLLHLLRTVLDTVDTNVADAGDTSAHGSSSTALGVLDSDDILVLNTQLLASEVVDLGVGLGGRRVEGGGSAEDVLVGEVVRDADLLNAGHDTGLRRGGDDGHGVALVLDPFEHLRSARAWLALLAQFRSDATELHLDVAVNLLVGHVEVVLVLQAIEHAAEVVTHKLLEQLVDRVASGAVILGKHLIGEIGASLESQTLTQAESVVAVQEDVLNLAGVRTCGESGGWARGEVIGGGGVVCSGSGSGSEVVEELRGSLKGRHVVDSEGRS